MENPSVNLPKAINPADHKNKNSNDRSKLGASNSHFFFLKSVCTRYNETFYKIETNMHKKYIADIHITQQTQVHNAREDIVKKSIFSSI